MRPFLNAMSEHDLSARPNTTPEIQRVLLNSQIGQGAFSYIYAYDEGRVMKFSQHIENLTLLAELSEKSPHYPVVSAIYENQAQDYENANYHAAIIEKLIDHRPDWVDNIIVTAFRARVRILTGVDSSTRLLEMSNGILTGKLRIPDNCRESFSEALALLGAACKEKGLVADFRHDLNFMTRADGTVVIADPAHHERFFVDYLKKISLEDLNFRPRHKLPR